MWGLPRVPDQVVHVIPQIRDRRYSPKYKVTETPSHGTYRLTLALPGANREKHLKSSSDKVPALVH
jgi:HSP20 family molecular chaperone IbpA